MKLREPDHIEYTWLVGERVSIGLDHGASLTTSVYFQAERIEPSVEQHHGDLAAANAEVARLLGGGWRDYFDDNPELLAELAREAGQ